MIIKKIVSYLKNVIENKILAKFFLLCKIDKLILFESIPNLTDNTKPVFDQMIKMGINKEYRCVWLVRDKVENPPKIENVFFVEMWPKSFKDRMRLNKLKATAKCLISCNYILTSLRKGQKSFYLAHGSPLKDCSSYYYLPNNVDYCFTQADSWNEKVSSQMHVKEEKIVSLGYPRTDIFLQEGKDLHKLFDINYKKILAWYPTYRQHCTGGQNAASKNALPIVFDKKNAEELNEYAKSKNILIVIKPHFAQDVSKIKKLQLSNIIFIDDAFFNKNNISSYEFVNSCDGLITDYSSIYYDYTLKNKPIAVVWEDVEEYRESPGFSVDLDKYIVGAEKIYNIDDFKTFINHISNNQDVLQKERNEIKLLVNKFSDGSSGEKIAKFIIKQAEL